MKSKALLKVFIPFTLGFVCNLSLASIYKITDENGNIKYTDTISENEAKALQDSKFARIKVQQLTLPDTSDFLNFNSLQTSQPNANPLKVDTDSILNNKLSDDIFVESNNDSLQPLSYKIKILSPANERAYHKPAQSMDIRVSVIPKLKDNNIIEMLIDGIKVGEGSSINIPTSALNPGQHTLEVRMVSDKGQEIKKKSLNFFVIQSRIARKKG